MSLFQSVLIEGFHCNYFSVHIIPAIFSRREYVFHGLALRKHFAEIKFQDHGLLDMRCSLPFVLQVWGEGKKRLILEIRGYHDAMMLYVSNSPTFPW